MPHRFIVLLLVAGCARSTTQDAAEMDRPTPTPDTAASGPAGTDVERMVESVAPRVSRSTEGLPIQVRPDGTRAIDLRGRYHHVAVARKQADGSVVRMCVASEPELRHALSPRELEVR